MMSILLALTAFAGTAETSCWNAATWDVDGDGYASTSASTGDRVTLTVPEAERQTCPAGWVKLRGDCDDTDASVHPRQWEVAGNGVDDDCNTLVDDHQFYYVSSGYNITDDSFDLYMRIQDDGAASAAHNGAFTSLSYAITYADLTDLGTTYTTAIQEVPDLWDGFGVQSTLLTLDGLDDGEVYRAKVQLYRSLTLFTPWGGTRTTHTPIGNESAWYYSMTSRSNNPTYGARTDMVNQALYERYRNNIELVGYLGWDQDGTRYGADPGEAWCSEFYSWVGDRSLDGMGHLHWTGAMQDWFEDEGNLITTSPDTWVQYFGQPGDYLALDTNNDGDTNHSAMFLAYDTDSGTLITIDGNTSGHATWEGHYRSGGNEVGLRNRGLSEVTGFGWLDSHMLP